MPPHWMIPRFRPKAALLVDAKTGNIVYAKNEHQEMYPASTTKIMTALLVMEAIDQGKLSLTDQLTASHTAMTTGSGGGRQYGQHPGRRNHDGRTVPHLHAGGLRQ